MEDRMTIEQVLEITAQQLTEILVPVSRAIGNLNACLAAIRRDKTEEAEDGRAGDE